MKNYISFINDHSGSMAELVNVAIADYNSNIAAIRDAATKEMLDTVVSVSEAGDNVRHPVTISNPHVLKPITNWRAGGTTPLWTAMIEQINMLSTLPDIDKPNTSILVISTTDGDATDSHMLQQLIYKVQEKVKTGRWTFVFRVPKHLSNHAQLSLKSLDIPAGNIFHWETTTQGMQAASVATQTAMTGYFASRSAGAKSSSAFYADTSNVNVAALEDVTSKISLYVVPDTDMGIEIRPFILRHRMEYLKGSAFYQLTKTEAKVGHQKKILVRDRPTGKFFTGNSARDMIGLPHDRNARLHPGDHKNFDIFIQSESVNRKLVAGTGVAYWKEIGVPFTEADLAYLKPKEAAPTTPVVQLPAVPVSNAPTKSPIPVTKKATTQFFETREEARQHCALVGRPQKDIQKHLNPPSKQHRWFIND